MTPAPVLECRDVWKTFRASGREVVAARGVDLTVDEGESVAIVGESGSGKSTLLRIALGLIAHDTGSVRVLGHNWAGLGHHRRRELLGQVGMVFQEPFESLDPRQHVLDIVDEPIRLHDRKDRAARRAAVVAALADVGLDESYLAKTPAEMSGGQQQRVGIARAIVRRPRLLLLDEPTSALDISVQAQVLQILERVRHELGSALVIVTHDLAVASYLADRIVVMRHGGVLEAGPTDQVLGDPRHEYTRSLIEANAIATRRD